MIRSITSIQKDWREVRRVGEHAPAIQMSRHSAKRNAPAKEFGPAKGSSYSRQCVR
jgi:hypothetical protein